MLIHKDARDAPLRFPRWRDGKLLVSTSAFQTGEILGRTVLAPADRHPGIIDHQSAALTSLSQFMLQIFTIITVHFVELRGGHQIKCAPTATRHAF
ncbi:MAG: hypothetical protein K0B14_17320, partial [Anaerolineaceae bacterium]|nr:hypothetical protein [Anaerolineaceae bacterium]